MLACSPSTISRLKTGEIKTPGPDLMDRITAVTGVTPNDWAKFRQTLDNAKNCKGRKRRKEHA